jgi:hypothetical protein
MNSEEANTLGGAAAIVTLLNSYFEMFNPILTGIFYIASITWLGVQIYYKIKQGK